MAHPTGGIDDRGESLRLPWSRSDRPVPRTVLRPLQSFLDTEAASGILLLTAAVVAMVWANSPWRDAYDTLWRTELTLTVGPFELADDLRHWVNDGLMALFFLVVGLEIKREFLTGELRDPRTATLPVLAALGGMIVPALLYLALNAGHAGARGWGIPMATDIAFALGVLTLAAKKAPPGLKPFLLTLAIVDDIGAIVVIAVFYSAGVSAGPLAAAVAGCFLIVVLQRIHVRSAGLYIALGLGVWVAAFLSGIHPTIAGVALGLLTPAVPFQRPRAVSEEAHRVADETVDEPEPPDADAHHWLSLTVLSREAVSPLARLEHALHPWTSYVIVPLFALANAGVRLSGESLGDAAASRVALGVLLGLVVGKIVGITLASFIAVRAGIARLPRGAEWRDVMGVGAVAGIGFTVSLFIADLAFGESRLDVMAKLGILGASILAGALGALLLSSRRASEPVTEYARAS